jgi:hypothetical protein
LHNNYIAQGARVSERSDGIVPDHSLTGGAGWAYGTAPWLESGAYLPIYTVTQDRQLRFDGAEIRALFVVPHAERLPFFYGLNLAFGFHSSAFDAQPLTAEIRPIVGARLGLLRVTFNPVLETTFDGFANINFSPATLADYTLSSRWSIALEHYAELGTLHRFAAAADQRHELFFVTDYAREALSIEAGVGRGLTQASDDLTFKLIVSRDL